MALWTLAYALGTDIDEVRSWSYHKIREWFVFFEAKRRLEEKD
jgi:hypothetical protein